MICEYCDNFKNQKCKLGKISDNTIYVYYCNDYEGEHNKNEFLENYWKLKGITVIDKLRAIEVGTRITAKIENTATANIHKQKLMYMGNIKHHGYITECGAWSLYEIPGTIKKCYTASFRKYGSKQHDIKIDFELKDFSLGW